MESFWLDTPFGITLLGGMIPTVLGLLWLVIAALTDRRAARYRLDAGEWTAALGWLLLYGVMTVIVSYLVILIPSLAAAFLGLPFFSPLEIGLWALCAVLLFRSFFRR
jgi:hypothetical protein